jgi:alanine dehydrogenase
VRRFSEVRIAGRTPAKVEALAAELQERLDVPVVAADGVESACDDAAVVCLTTDAAEPVLDRTWLAPGTHVTAVGFSAKGRELDTATVADALLVVEERGSAFAAYPVGSNDLGLPLAEGAIGADHVYAELGELVAGTRPARTDDQQLTLYKSSVAAQDVAAAKLVYDAAVAANVGQHFSR